MFGHHPLLLVLAGFGAGLTGSIAGLASLISYPALLAIGLPPVTANVTNTVALVFNGIGSTSGSVPELRGQWPWLKGLLIAGLLGGAAGSFLLLITPPGAFELAVPWLIAVGSIAIVVPMPARLGTRPAGADRSPAVGAAMFVVAVYGGYFGAAAGVLMLAVLLTATTEGIARASAVKNAVLGTANGVAAVGFAAFGPVRWSVVVPLAIGLLAGGRLGPIVVRRAPVRVLRILIALAGLGLAVHLGIDAYT
ncbi:MAG: sulfite exporter TauE/SafE family protein [Actinomycetota bacterium]|nr:sulfite exporter TauE/SafE family protein [Actinomycetota bacterium]